MNKCTVSSLHVPEERTMFKGAGYSKNSFFFQTSFQYLDFLMQKPYKQVNYLKLNA